MERGGKGDQNKFFDGMAAIRGEDTWNICLRGRESERHREVAPTLVL